MLQNFGNRFELWQQFKIETFFAAGDSLDRHAQSVFPVERGYDVSHGHPSPRVESLFFEGAIPFCQRLLPRDVMKRHGIGNGAVAVKQVRSKRSLGQFQSHGWVLYLKWRRDPVHIGLLIPPAIILSP